MVTKIQKITNISHDYDVIKAIKGEEIRKRTTRDVQEEVEGILEEDMEELSCQEGEHVCNVKDMSDK